MVLEFGLHKSSKHALVFRADFIALLTPTYRHMAASAYEQEDVCR